jgi:hypothetical protein
MPRHLQVQGEDYQFPDDGRTYYVDTIEHAGDGFRYRKRYTILPDGSGTIRGQKIPANYFIAAGADLPQEEPPWENAGTFPPQPPPKRQMNSGPIETWSDWRDDYTHRLAEKDRIVEERKGLSTTEKARILKDLYTHPSVGDIISGNIWGKSTYKEEVEEPGMSKYITGTRVSFIHPESGDLCRGTVIDLRRELVIRDGYTFICSDHPDVACFHDGARWAGAGHGVLVPVAGVRLLKHPHSPGTLGGVPNHIGVATVVCFDFDGVKFDVGHTGRLLSLDESGDQAFVHWYTIKDANFYEGHGANQTFSNCFAVPRQNLQWCRLSSEKRPVEMWPAGSVSASRRFKKGDYVVYNSDRPCKIATHSGHLTVAKGTVLVITDNEPRRNCVTATVRGGRARGLQALLEVSTLKKLDFPYLEEGNLVEISAKLEFKSRNLQGQRGTVVLPTDADGDVGIQFLEEVGGGSLDGQGKDRHCLYVPTALVKKTS